jgi:adenylate cyclase
VLSVEPEADKPNADRRGDRRTAEGGGHRRLTPKTARYGSVVGEYSRREAAERAGVSVDDLNPLVELGMLTPDDDDRFSAGDVRRIGLIQSFVAAGLPLDGLAADMRQGGLSLAFLDSPGFDRFPSFSGVTFQELSTQTGVPVELLMVIREAIGAALPAPGDRVREDEMAIVPLVEAQLESGFKHATIERALRAIGDSLRRVAEVEADWFRTEVIEPRAAGKTGAEISAVAVEFSERFTPLNDRAVGAMYHAHQAHASTGNLIGGFERALAAAGLHSRLARPPAMCFLDITGYTRLTQERGDEAAADLAEKLGRLVQRTSVQHGGRPVKWLGDGVMFYFRDPGPGVMAALEMVEGVADAGLPPAHVGLHSGPVVFQAGDYYGQTVNVAARIAEYARPGEVVVSQAVVDASQTAHGTFTEIGPVELKGVSGVIRLYAARHAP